MSQKGQRPLECEPGHGITDELGTSGMEFNGFMGKFMDLQWDLRGFTGIYMMIYPPVF